MGIPGLINYIGSGERVSLAAFAVRFLQERRRPIRIAIDISIWLYQMKASKGGFNPELRTLLFRLTRLTTLPIHPLFVYDGKDRPRLKRGRVVRGSGGTVLERQSQRLLDAFKLPWHTAPGEAEAECALLQRAGVVDAVMTEDIDAVMFGSEVTLLNYQKEGSVSASTAATHVSVYRTRRSIKGQPPNVWLSRQSMILFALLSGGDYIPAGVPKCGTKLASEIVAAGFGKSLMAIFRDSIDDQEERLAAWRRQLEDELHTNASGFFKTKHKAVTIPDTFPDKEVLLAYAIPVISTPAEVRSLKASLGWIEVLDSRSIHRFTQEVLAWEERSGAISLTNVLGPSLLTQRFLRGQPAYDDLIAVDDSSRVIVCSEKSATADCDYIELRIEFDPVKVTGLASSSAPTAEPSAASTSNGSQAELPGDRPDDTVGLVLDTQVSQRRRVWVPEPVAELGIADAIAAYHRSQEAKQDERRAAAEEKAKRAAAREARAHAKKVLDPSMKEGAILKYAKVVKPKPSPMAERKPPSTHKDEADQYLDLTSSQLDGLSSSFVLDVSQASGCKSASDRDSIIEEQCEALSQRLSQQKPSPETTDTTDLEEIFDSQYNYEGLRREAAQRDASNVRRARAGEQRRTRKTVSMPMQRNTLQVPSQAQVIPETDSHEHASKDTVKKSAPVRPIAVINLIDDVVDDPDASQAAPLSRAAKWRTGRSDTAKRAEATSAVNAPRQPDRHKVNAACQDDRYYFGSGLKLTRPKSIIVLEDDDADYETTMAESMKTLSVREGTVRSSQRLLNLMDTLVADGVP
ncbi:hypothetical protein KEM52_000013 [Ascosphaera acerosa]|nr:hypothetical protein KEM52_000013 [Ascosphaera acerosa]